MALSWNEIRIRASSFSKKWEDAADEKSQASPFLLDFFEVFGITNKRVATFEHAVKKFAKSGIKATHGYIDLFWTGLLLVEMKSKGKDLDSAYDQAIDYLSGIKERDLPRYILVSDFQRFRLFDQELKTHIEFDLKNLFKNVKAFGFIAGYQTQIIKSQDPINIKAAERMGKLHDALKATGYEGHELELYLVRLLFCLFAEDTTIFEKGLFQDYIENKTADDGSDLAHHIASIFHILNTPLNKRLKNLDEHLMEFPYVNGKLFEEVLTPAQFDKTMRERLLDLCALDWSKISPAIFGSLFQSIMDVEARRNFGAHYTSEENILKLIKPLFLDDLWAEFEKIKRNKNKLAEFQKKLRTLIFFDPACGCGNFLVITYRELRLLEIEVLRNLYNNAQQVLDVEHLIQINVDQFYGLEIEEFPAQIAQVALWLTDHQMNMRISDEFGNYFARIPLKSTPHIVHANALQLDWEKVIAPERCSYILGNPPFVGAKYMDNAQRADVKTIFNKVEKGGLLDFVAAWYVKAAQYIQFNNHVKCAFVSTNSITQGEQVGVLWGWMASYGIKIHFAHRTFRWSNEARGKAAVHCIIIGFGTTEKAEKVIFEYEDVKGEPHAIIAKNINPYLVDAPDILIPKRSKPICVVQPMQFGNQPIDGGHLILSSQEREELIAETPEARPFIKLFLGAVEFINSIERYCLWLKDAPPKLIRQSSIIRERINSVKAFREASDRPATNELANTPTKFAFISHTDKPYLIVPSVSSERRTYIPIGFLNADVIASNLCLVVPNASIYDFGVLTSTMHNAWVRSVCGRLKSDFRYSVSIVYNNYPWPEPSEKQIETIGIAAKEILKIRASFPKSSLADLYDPISMPSNLHKAHQALDKAIDKSYGFKGKNTDAARVAFLLECYQKTISLIPVEKRKKKS